MKVTTCLFYTGAIISLSFAILIGVAIRLSQIPNDIVIKVDETTKSIFQPSSLTTDQIQTYEKEGVVMIPGLLSPQESDMIVKSGEYAMGRVFSIAKLFGTKLYSSLAFDVWRTSPEIASLALQALPEIAAPLLAYSKNLEGEVEFRLLRDAMFQYTAGGEGCGWHVDDVGFWPTEEDKDGPTIWIALDEISVSEGGGLALVNRTLFEETSNVTMDECRKAIKVGTCDMKKLHPVCYENMEASMMEWNMKPGDAIIWNRWTFHRGVAAKVEMDPTTFVKRRYSVRYMPHGSKAGPFIHSTVNSGEYFDSPYYPKVWPSLQDEELSAIEHGLEADNTLISIGPFIGKMLLKKFMKRT